MGSLKARLGVEVLEGKLAPGSVLLPAPLPPSPLIPPTPPRSAFLLPSAPSILAPPPSTIAGMPAPVTKHALAGGGIGFYVCTLKYANTPSGFHFNAMADLRGMGKVSVQADVYGVGFRSKGHASGQVTFTDAQGSVTVQLTGPEQARLSTLPEWFQYKVVGGTGKHAQMKDFGTLRLSRSPDAVPIRGGFQFHETGSFRIRI